MQDKGLCEQCVFSNNGHRLLLSFKQMRGDLPITPSSLNLGMEAPKCNEVITTQESCLSYLRIIC